ncbi:hypothetical protein SY83_08075 [Paenibacillus swuensis]|uniref:HTH araC/xylS-type domain-containing protein n=1 Tax=Paenibacillus swuensis TaxID=1178515 RepID=A0A172TGP7_9BACL|nr:helix-turn-helix domain-containing protein [Paenibacillus swuensis]ANE46235.1 hypothetical protein SY83_08075 [Paenibacillus swuensis]
MSKELELAHTTAPPAGLFICDYFEQKEDYFAYRPDGTRDWLVIATVSGEGVFRVGEESIVCKAGDLALIKPGTMHHYTTFSGGRWNFYWAHFLPKADWPQYLLWSEPLKGMLMTQIDLTDTRERIYSAFRRMIEDNRQGGRYGEALAQNSLLEVLMLAARQQAWQTENGMDHRVQDVLRRMAENLKDQHRVTALAKAVHLSPSRLSHLFKEQVGDSIIEVLLKMRLKQAGRLLHYTDRQVQEIAEDVGFASPFYFTEQFTRFYGMNPSEYRRLGID